MPDPAPVRNRYIITRSVAGGICQVAIIASFAASYGPETTRKGIALRGVSFLRSSVVDEALIGAGPGPGELRRKP